MLIGPWIRTRIFHKDAFRKEGLARTLHRIFIRAHRMSQVRIVAHPLAVGDSAPNVTLRNDEDRPVRLPDLWREKPLALFFVRHYG